MERTTSPAGSRRSIVNQTNASKNRPEERKDRQEDLKEKETALAEKGLAVPLITRFNKAEFLSAMEESVRNAADPILAKAGRSTAGCPWINFVFHFYRHRNPEAL